MKIKHDIYRHLTPQQRVIASFEALSRGDLEEEAKIRKACPRREYVMNDHCFWLEWNNLSDLIIATEYQLCLNALIYFMNRLDETGDPFAYISRMVHMDAALTKVLSEKGITRDVWRKAIPMRHPLVEAIITNSSIKPNPEAVELLAMDIRDRLTDWSASIFSRA